jgi:hypothetical protein
VEIPLEGLGVRETYKLLIGSVLPRPIAWVSTQDQAGRVKLDPVGRLAGNRYSTIRDQFELLREKTSDQK